MHTISCIQCHTCHVTHMPWCCVQCGPGAMASEQPHMHACGCKRLAAARAPAAARALAAAEQKAQKKGRREACQDNCSCRRRNRRLQAAWPAVGDAQQALEGCASSRGRGLAILGGMGAGLCDREAPLYDTVALPTVKLECDTFLSHRLEIDTFLCQMSKSCQNSKMAR